MNRQKIEYLKILIAIISAITLIPHLIFFNLHSNKSTIRKDLFRWMKVNRIDLNMQISFIYVMRYFPEFRNLFYKRIGIVSTPFIWLCPKVNTLFIVTEQIGGGYIWNTHFPLSLRRSQ